MDSLRRRRGAPFGRPPAPTAKAAVELVLAVRRRQEDAPAIDGPNHDDRIARVVACRAGRRAQGFGGHAQGQAGDIQWNFEKFLVSPEGNIVARFRPQTSPESDEVVKAVESVLAA